MVDTEVKKLTDIFLSKESTLSKIPILLLGLGLISLVYWGTFYSVNKERAMFGYLFAFTVILSLALGSMGFVLIQHLTRAGWSVVIRRIPEVAMSLSPLFIILFLPIAFTMHDIFPWTHAGHIDEILRKKLPYLNENFFLIRSFGYLFCWSLIGVLFYRCSIKQDLGKRDDLTNLMQALSAPGIVIFGLSLTFASFDWLMSLQPHWYSTIFGVYFFSGCFLFALSFMTLIAIILQKFGFLTKAITGEHYHDLGKLMFGFTIFWAYISFSQFMLYWYGGIPEEIEFYTVRLQNGWALVSWSIPVIHFFIPFFSLMSRTLKRIKIVLVINCLWIILVHIVDLYWLIMPALEMPEGKNFSIAISDIFVFLGMILIFLGLFFLVLRRSSLLPNKDPRLSESLLFENF